MLLKKSRHISKSPKLLVTSKKVRPIALATLVGGLVILGIFFIFFSHAASCTLMGDANCDGVVNIIDLSILASNWGNTTATWNMGDFNGDGIVNILDLSILAANWNQTSTSTYAVPSNIPADCSVEVSAQLNAWIASVPDGTANAQTMIEFPANACYWVDNAVALGQIVVNQSNAPQNGRHYLYIEGNNATLKAKNLAPVNTKRDELAIISGSNITVHNLNATGVNTVASYTPQYEHDANFSITGSHYVTLDDVHGSDAYGDCVDTGPAEFVWPDSEMVQNFTLKNSSCNTTGRMGIDCTGCNGFTVDHNSFDNIGYHAFDLEVEDATWQAHNVYFTNNTIGYVYLSAVSDAGQSYDQQNINITGNNETSKAVTCYQPVYIDWGGTTENRPGPYVITGNHFNTASDVVWINHANNVTVQNNTTTYWNGGCGHSGVEASSSVGGNVSNNDFTGEDTSYTNLDGLASGYTVCDNKLTPGGAFDQPAVCH
ncbi:MAG: dockerin type I domain-containing protein [Candidatus Saccharimonadia bacterium]